MSEYQCLVEWDRPIEEQVSKYAMQSLTEAYPGHPWHTDVRGGVLVIKHMRMTNKYGMAVHYMKCPDATTFKKGVVMSGGELLERAGLTRGADSGEMIAGVDGIPRKDLVHG